MGSQNAKSALSNGRRHIFIDILGVLSAFVIAVGGLVLVQGSLTREQEGLLAGGGRVELPGAETVEAAEKGEAFALGELAEDELLQLVQGMSKKGEAQPHEPVQGQLSMVQAFDCGRGWLEEFFLPRFGLSGLFDAECRISCYLWTPEAGSVEADPWRSCWTVSFINQEIEAELYISAVSGQILRASLTCSAPVSYQSSEDLMTVLTEYALSFDLEEEYSVLYSEETETGAKKLPWYCSMGKKGLYAALDAGGTTIVAEAVVDKESGEVTYLEREYFEICLYLCFEPEIPLS